MTSEIGRILHGQVAVVTGGGRGIGRAMALRLAAAGAKVALVARSLAQLETTAATIRQEGGIARTFSLDVTDSQAVQRMARDVAHLLGPVTLLVNNAGVIGPLGPVWEVDEDAWWQCLNINLRGPFLCTRALLPGMMARRQGRIINVSSGAALHVANGVYPLSKAAVLRWSEGLAEDLRTYGIAVFAIDPGTVRTAMTESMVESEEGRRYASWLPQFFAEGRDEPPERAADLVLALASGRADALSGCFVSIQDDLDALIDRAQEIRDRELQRMRLRR